MTSRPRPPDADALLAEGEALAREGRFDEAAGRYVESTLADPTRPDGYVGAARALAERGEAEAAIVLITQALKVDPSFLPAYGLAARIGLHFPDHIFEGLRLLEMGVLARDDSVEVWVWFGRLQATLGRVPDLRRTLRALERRTDRLRTELVRDLADDPDMRGAAVLALRRAANLEF